MDRQTLLFFIIIIVLAIGGYMYFQSGSAELPAGSSEKTAEFEAHLGELRVLTGISFDISILQNEFFKALLMPPASSIHSITAGRSNPFLPYQKEEAQPKK